LRIEHRLLIGLLCREAEAHVVFHCLLVGQIRTQPGLDVLRASGDTETLQLDIALLVTNLTALRHLHDVLHGSLIGDASLLLATGVSLSSLHGLTESLRALFGDKPIALALGFTCSNTFLHRLTRTTECSSTGSLCANILLAQGGSAVNIRKPRLDHILRVRRHVLLDVTAEHARALRQWRSTRRINVTRRKRGAKLASAHLLGAACE
jgi:hypothetical protein